MSIRSLPGRIARLISLFALLCFGGCRKSTRELCPVPAASYVLRLGEQLSIRLASNPSTGYAWAWENRGRMVVVDSSGWSYSANRPGIPGGVGCETWTFTAKAPGTDSLRMAYRRLWEPGSGIETRVIAIRVR